MSIVRNILVRVGAEISPLQQSMNQANNSLNRFTRGAHSSMSEFQSILRRTARGTSLDIGVIVDSLSMGKMGLIALGTVAVTSFALISKKSIEAAMNVVESENLFSVSMGNMADSAREWSNQLQDSLGLNAYEVRNNVGLFYNMTTSMGVARNKAYEVSKGLTMLSYDMASFYNMPYQDAFEKLQSGISGEVEPLKRLGIIINETTTQNYAYTHGIAKQGATLTEIQKILARYGVIMEQTKNAQGDLARTITSPANQLRILQTQLQLASINLGNAFMPIVEAVLPILVNFAKGLVTVTNTLSQFMHALFGTNAAQTQNAVTANKASFAVTSLGNATKKAGKSTKNALAPFDQLNVLSKAIATNATSAADSTDALSTSPLPEKQNTDIKPPKWLSTIANNIRKDFTPAFIELRKAWDSLKYSAKDLWNALSPLVKPIFNAIKDQIKGLAIGGVFVLSGAVETLSGYLRILTSLIRGDLSDAFKGLKSIGSGLYNILKGVLDAFAGPEVGTRLDNLAVSLKSGVGNVIKNAGPTFSNLKNSIENQIEKIDLKSAWHTVINGIKDVWDTLQDYKNGIPSKLTSLKNSIINIIANSKNFIKPITDAMNGVASSIGNVWESLRVKTADIWANIASIPKNAINSVIDGINKFITKLNGFKVSIPSVKIPGINKSIGGGSIGMPQIPSIPKLAGGGIISTPTIAMIGEKGREAVVPLENSGFIDSLSSSIAHAVVYAISSINNNKNNSNNYPDTLVLKIGEAEFGRLSIKAINNVQRQAGVTLLKV